VVAGAAAGLYGRRRELATVDELLRGTVQGHGGSLLVTGEPGVGKSRLAEAAADTGRAMGADVLVGRAVPLAIDRLMGAVLDAFGLRVIDVLGSAGSARTVLEAGAMAATGFLLSERLLESLEARSARGPVLLVLEDLQWADAATLDWCTQVTERAPEGPVGVMMTSRPPRPGTPLHRAVDRLSSSHIELGPLGPADVVELAGALLSATPGPVLRAELEGTAGNPLLVVALLEALLASGGLTERDGVVDATSRDDRLASGPIAAQVAELDELALRVLQVAAVLGPRFSLGDLSSVLERRAVDLLTEIDVAVAAGVVVPADDRYAFRHELHRDAVLATLPAAAVAPIHLDVARALAASGAPATEVAEHYAAGARPGNRQAVAWLQRAALEIVDQSPGTALRLLDVAVGLSASAPSPELLLTRVRALTGAGHMAEAEALARSLLREGLDAEMEARLHRELGFAYFVLGRASESVDAIHRYRKLIGDTRMQGRASAELAFTQFVSLDHEAARSSASVAVEEGRRTGDVAAEVGGGSVLCMLSLFVNDFSAANAWADRIVALAEQPHAVDGHLYQRWFVAAVAWNETDEFERLARAVRRGRDVADRRGAAWAIPGYDAIAAFAAMRVGELDDARAAAEATLAYLDGADGFGVAVWCHSFLAQIALHRGDQADARHHVDVAEAWLARGRAQFGLEQWSIAKARLCEREGDGAAALAALTDVWRLFTALPTLPARQDFGPYLVRLACDAGDMALAESVVAELQEAAAKTGSVTFAAQAALAHAHVTGDAAAASAAADLVRGSPRRPLLATALTDASLLARRAGRRADADRLGSEAAQVWATMGADSDAEAVLAPLRVRPPALRPRFGIEALTATERHVVALIAEGLSNAAIAHQLYISRRTVESHVSAAYRKLEVGSRVEVARVAMAHGLTR